MGQAARGAMVQAGLTQATLCTQMPMSLQSLGRRLRGTLPFTYPELARLAEVTGVAVAELVVTAERIAERELVNAA